VDHVDVAIVGLGGIGSATAWFAARRGLSVAGFERHTLGGHHFGASHDHSRIIRHSYHTVHYVELTFGAYQAWGEVEAASGERCVHVTGGIDMFPANAAIDIDTYSSSMASAGVSFDQFDGRELRRRWPQFTVADDVAVLHQANTGLVSPAHTVDLMQRLANGAGAALRGGRAVTAIEPDDHTVQVVLDDGERVVADHVVVSADAWTVPLLAPLGVHLPLTVTKEQVTYYDTSAPDAFALGASPVWIWMDDPSFYGFPTFGRPGVKVAEDCGGKPVHPDTRGFDADSDILARTNAFVWDTFGGRLTKPLHTTTCLYTLTPDRDFVIDQLPGHPNITVALGSGHGYKFAAWFGRTLAALADNAHHGDDLTPFALNRPALTDPGYVGNWLV
jgi:sarcosine oxidase